VNTGKVILATLVIFVAGLVTGALLVWQSDRLAMPRSPRLQRPENRAAQPLSPGGMRVELLRRMQRDLDLTAEQRERTDKLLKESQERTREITKPIAAELRAEVQRTTERFREVLTREQLARFEELLKKQAHPHDQRRPRPAEGRTNTSTGTP
jgi:Spy/CpxP family protein refolding chaperone